jgi:peptidoglycan/LPS O-acetylase OafA/YrhL
VKIVSGIQPRRPSKVAKMPRARWFVVGFLVVAAVVGALLNARGPFAAHQPLAYDQFLADFQAGRVEQIATWRDQLEVADQGTLRSVVVPANRDLPADLAAARAAGGVGLNYTALPDAWLTTMTPWIPVLLAVAALLIWVTAIVRNRRVMPGSSHTASPIST